MRKKMCQLDTVLRHQFEICYERTYFVGCDLLICCNSACKSVPEAGADVPKFAKAAGAGGGAGAD